MSKLQSLFEDVYNASDSDDKRQRVRRLWDFAIGSVHLVDRGANKRKLLIKKSEDQDDLFGDVVTDDDGELSVAFFDSDEDVEKAVWSTAFVNDLPDSAFLFIESGGKKDDKGMTEPRSLRHFPVRGADGKPDAAHVRNAVARIPQSNAPGLTPEKKKALQEQARKLLEELNKSHPDTAADTMSEITQKALGLMKSVQDGSIDNAEFAAEAEAIGQLLASISPSHHTEEEEAVKTNEIDTMKMAIAQAKSPQTCAYCDEPAAHGLVYNEGKEFIPVCGAHVMQGTNDLKAKEMKVEEKVAMPSKEKKAADPEADAAGEGEDEKGKKKKPPFLKKSEHPAASSIAAEISKSVDDMAIELEKAGRKMAKARVAKLREALVKLLELAKELDPSEAQEILASSVKKRLGDVEGVEDADVAKAAGDDIPDGKSSDTSVAKSADSDDDEGFVQWGVNLNDPSLHRDTVDKDVSFFD